MKTFLELFLFLGIYFPIYHLINVAFSLRKAVCLQSAYEKPITILVPCYNEERILKTTIQGLRRIDYDNYECLIINDGSTDNSLRVLKRFLKLKKTKRRKQHSLSAKKVTQIYQSKRYPFIFVLNKEKHGKSDALNAGINYTKNDYIITLDADSVLKEDALKIVNNALDDENVVAASGIIQILQASNLTKKYNLISLPLNTLLKLQTIEYIKSCFCYKASFAKLKSLLVISGAFGIFKKDILMAVKGFSHVIGEDLDLTIKIQLHIQNTNYQIAYLPNAICYTEGPETLKDLMKQRKRWRQSFIECLFTFKDILFTNIFSKRLHFFIVVDALIIGLISSLIIAFFFIIIIINIITNNIANVLFYLIIYISVHLAYNICGLLVASYHGIKYQKKDFFRLAITIILDILIYRLIILYTVIMGTISYFTSKNNWHKVTRSGRDYQFLKQG
ncbi:MAG: glycosyltransferase [Bacilli bacterium]